MKRHSKRLLEKMLRGYRVSGKVHGMKLNSEEEVYLLWKSYEEQRREKERKKEREHDKRRHR